MALDLSVWLPRFNRRVRKLEREVPETPKEIARWGATHAKTIAPRDTGSLIQAIAWKTGSVGSKSTAIIFVRDSTNPKHFGVHQRVARYAALHHKMALDAKYQAKTGDPHWAFTITRLAKDRFSKELKTKFDILKK